MNMRYAMRSEDTEQINVVSWANWNMTPLSGIEMAAPCTERRQQEQAGGGETQTDGCQGGSERPLLAISERNLLRTIHRDEVRRQQAAGITERVPQRHGRGRSFRGDLLLRRGGNRGHQEIFISQ